MEGYNIQVIEKVKNKISMPKVYDVKVKRYFSHNTET